MGLLDVLNGMQNGPHGNPTNRTTQPSSSGMSPMTMALIGLLAYKAMKSFGGNTTQTAPNVPPTSPTSPTAPTTKAGGGLGDILGGLFGGGNSPASNASTKSLNDLIPGGLGGLLTGNKGGDILSGGLGNLIKDLQTSGGGGPARSWVSPGPNEDISKGDLSKALGADTIDTLSRQTGMTQDELLEGLRQHLPGFVDHLTPNGRVPTPDEVRRMV
jgi:uncharacterized protein YidB (DUF937 family)